MVLGRTFVRGVGTFVPPLSVVLILAITTSITLEQPVTIRFKYPFFSSLDIIFEIDLSVLFNILAK